MLESPLVRHHFNITNIRITNTRIRAGGIRRREHSLWLLRLPSL